jgi:hypothetical protein
MNYKIPDDILAKIPEYFWPAVAGELVSVYSPSVFVKDEDGLCGMDFIIGTSGWHVVLKATCRKLDMDWLYEYYCKLEWYDSDWFDGEMFDLIKNNFVDAEVEHANSYYKWLVEKE